uniref:Uncharacterized protein n=1 Tax=Glossina brevipalpis TaxID=37001 RepID=A0A1A9W443_9MUSC
MEMEKVQHLLKFVTAYNFPEKRHFYTSDELIFQFICYVVMLCHLTVWPTVYICDDFELSDQSKLIISTSSSKSLESGKSGNRGFGVGNIELEDSSEALSSYLLGI